MRIPSKWVIAAVAFILPAASAAGVRLYAKRRQATQPARPVARTVKGVLPPLETTVPGVTLTGEVVPQGEYELLKLTVHNDTDEQIDAWQVTGQVPSPTGWADAPRMFLLRDARFPRSPDETYMTTPQRPLLPPHSQDLSSFNLSAIPDAGKLVLSAAALHDGRFLGSEVKELRIRRARSAETYGFPAEWQALAAETLADPATAPLAQEPPVRVYVGTITGKAGIISPARTGASTTTTVTTSTGTTSAPPPDDNPPAHR